jgi:hypothetical protein
VESRLGGPILEALDYACQPSKRQSKYLMRYISHFYAKGGGRLWDGVAPGSRAECTSVADRIPRTAQYCIA